MSEIWVPYSFFGIKFCIRFFVSMWLPSWSSRGHLVILKISPQPFHSRRLCFSSNNIQKIDNERRPSLITFVELSYTGMLL